MTIKLQKRKKGKKEKMSKHDLNRRWNEDGCNGCLNNTLLGCGVVTFIILSPVILLAKGAEKGITTLLACCSKETHAH